MHCPSEKDVDETRDGLTSAEIVLQRYCLAKPFTPGPDVVQKNVRIRQAKPINALLYVTAEEPIGGGTLAAERLDDSILCCVDVLVFVHKNKLEFFLPFTGDRGRLAVSIVPEQTQGVLLEVVKIQHSQFAFIFRESRTKLAGQFQERFHLAPDPLP